MTDKRAYFKLDVGYLTNPKVALIMAQSPTAVLLHIGSIAYSAQHLTDGVVPVSLLMRLSGAVEGDDDLLFDAGLWLPRDGGRAEIRDYLKHQRSSSEAKGASDKAAAAARARWDAGKHAPEHAGGDARDGALRMPREKEREKKVRDDVAALCAHLADRIEANGSKRPNINKTWTDSARLLLDNDKRDHTEALQLIDWSQESDFWRPNVLSMKKFREKYDTLRLQADRDKPKPTRNPNIPEGW